MRTLQRVNSGKYLLPSGVFFRRKNTKASRVSALIRAEIQPNFAVYAQYFTIRALDIITHSTACVKRFLALSLLMALVFGTNYHNFSVSLNDFALIAHRLYRRSDFHNFLLFSSATGFPRSQGICSYLSLLLDRSPSRAYDLLRQVILPLVKSYGLISSFTLSPSMIRI